jgi:hypothetical protein
LFSYAVAAIDSAAGVTGPPELIFWLEGESPAGTANLSPPEMIGAGVVEDLEAAWQISPSRRDVV